MSGRMKTGLALLAALLLLAIAGPWIAPDPNAQPDPLNGALLLPSAAHWLGTDALSRDLFARLAWGARSSLAIAGVAVVVAAGLGSLVGLLAAGDGALAAACRRLVDLGLALPRLVVLLVLLATVGRLPPLLFGAVVGATGWAAIARLVRGEALRLRHETYVTAARALGEAPWRIALRHIFPGTLPPVLVASTLGVADAILLEAGLSFIGLGVPAPRPTWGGMVFDAYGYLAAAPWLLFVPAAALVAATSAATLLGDALRSSLQPDRR